MKKLGMILAASLMVCATAVAQNNNRQAPPKQGNKTEMRQDCTQQMVKDLGLNDSQAQKIKALNEKYAKKMGPQGACCQGQNKNGKNAKDNKECKQQGKQGNPPQLTDAQKKEMKSNREAYEKELKKILSDSQYKTYQSKYAKGPGNGKAPKAK